MPDSKTIKPMRKKPPINTDTHLISARFNTDAYRQFKVAAAMQMLGTNDVLYEALADWFMKYEQAVPESIRAHLNSIGRPPTRPVTQSKSKAKTKGIAPKS